MAHSDYHLSMYVRDFAGMFARMHTRGLVFVNPRFKRQVGAAVPCRESLCVLCTGS